MDHELVLSGRVELRGERVHEALEAGGFARIGPGEETMHELVAQTSAELLLVRVTDPDDVTTFG